IGNGQVIEARGTIKGVIQSPLRGPGAVEWTHWLEVPFISYGAGDTQAKPQGPTTVKIKYKGIVKTIPGVNRDGSVYVLVNGKEVPVRATLEALGVSVGWDQVEGAVLIL
ncbi:MAG: hypothetical protein GXZ11_03785, partial [Tissierellia bacterium]|nr:hypothetical protein [Tissierellia bacterium]